MTCEVSAGLSPDGVSRMLGEHDYLADTGLATALFLALSLRVPLLLEGQPGVGKTEVAKRLAVATGRRLVRLQCYEGIDAAAALYDWNYPRQLMHLQRATAADQAAPDQAADQAVEEDVFTERFLLERPLLSALRGGDGVVLLIDEIDRADDAFEAFLLEILSDFQITIPELGPVRASEPPVVVLTSNRTRELHDALRRRCLYHWIEYPDPEREAAIIRLGAGDLPPELVRDISAAVARLRALELVKVPGVSESILWARALAALRVRRLDPAAAAATLGAVLKDHGDLTRVLTLLGQVLGDDD